MFFGSDMNRGGQKEKRPLAHIRVLDFGQYLAGPLVGMMLADMGAEVIRIVPPDGPAFDDPAFAMVSRGKTSLTLDLQSERGRDTAIELAKRADVVVENFRPGVMDRLGVGPQALRAANDQLVYLSMPGFASSDPDLAPLPAWEAVIAAYTGQFTDMGLNRRLMGINPSFTPLALASAYGASFGALSVLFALYAREHCGGDHIEVPLASALLEGLAHNCQQVEAYPDRYKSPREHEIERRERENLPFDLDFKTLTTFLDPFYRTYMCADGRGFYVVSSSIASHPRRTLEVLGLTELADEMPDFSPYLDSAEWPAEWTQRNYPVGPSDRERIASAMEAAFLTKPAHEWEVLFGAAKAPGTAQRFSKEWLADPHALASGLILSVEDSTYGEMRQMGNVAWLSDDPAVAQKTGPVQADLGSLLQEPLRNTGNVGEGPWLQGLKVLDLTNVIAGPTIGTTLARFGAEVTSVQPVEPTLDPWNAVVFGLQAHRGKESLLLNLTTQKGRDVLQELIADVDVITMNATDEQRDRLGLRPETLEEINSEVILVQVDAYGGPHDGPKSNHLGYDDLVQAATGVMVRFGGGMETAEEHAHVGTIDVLTGLCGCVALGGALLRLKRTGKGGIARSSLATAGNLIQAQFMYDFEGRPPFNEPAGREPLGWGPFYHCYEASDAWVFLAAPTERYDALARVPELADLVCVPEETLHAKLAQRLKEKPAHYWCEAFTGDSTVVPVATLEETRQNSLQCESGGKIDISKATFRIVRHDLHPMGRWVDLVAPNAVRPENGKIVMPGPMPKYGADTLRIVSRLGYTEAQIQEMLDENVIGRRWSQKFLPE